MSETDPTIPTPRTRSERELLAYLSAQADDEGCSVQTKQAISEATSLSRSTLAVAVAGLREIGLLVVETSPGRAPNVYCVQPSDPTIQPSDSNRPIPESYRPIEPSEPSDSGSVDAPAREPAPATPERGGSPPTPYVPPAATGSEEPSRDARALEPSDGQPSDEPIGRLAVRTALDSARAAGRSIEPALRARIGHAAQALAKDETVETILAAARRLGEGGFSDLYTAVRAVDRGAAPPAPVADPIPEGARLAPVVALVRATWPRAVVDLAVWERELAKIPASYLVEGVREIARSGAEFAPTWGQVYRSAWRIGVDATERRRSAEERAAIRERVRAIEES